MSKFFVYEYWRPDTDQCFYVGKGSGARAYIIKRQHNGKFLDLLSDLADIGMFAEVRMVKGGLTEIEAFSLEQDRIAFWKGAGIALVNQTEGGLAATGYRHSERTRKRISESNKGRVITPEMREKLRAANLGKKASAETRAKMSATRTGRKGFPSVFKGKNRPPETCAKMSAAMKGRPVPPETRAKISATLKARKVLS